MDFPKLSGGWGKILKNASNLGKILILLSESVLFLDGRAREIPFCPQSPDRMVRSEIAFSAHFRLTS